MSLSSDVQTTVDWYNAMRPLYEALARKAKSIVREILESSNLNYHSITSRAKSIDSYKRKAVSAKYKDPGSEIFDMAGIRVIMYTDSDAKAVYHIVKDTFKIRPEHTINKSDELGVDRVGYRSIHCVGTLGKHRIKLPEYRVFKGMCFEIQIRTILQHAWAEFEHDRNYKFRGVLPTSVQRRFSILAGNLELIDREFDLISAEIDSYAQEIGRRTDLGELDVPIDSTSLREFLSRRFEALVKRGVRADLADDKNTIEQIHDMGINTLQKFDDLIPEDYIEIKLLHFEPPENFHSLIVDILIIHDIEAYFAKAWKHKWAGTFASDIPVYSHYGIDFKKYAEMYDIDILSNGLPKRLSP